MILHSTFMFFLAAGNIMIAGYLYHSVPRPVSTIDSTPKEEENLTPDAIDIESEQWLHFIPVVHLRTIVISCLLSFLALQGKNYRSGILSFRETAVFDVFLYLYLEQGTPTILH